ncbi:class I adenylate-forming enzyme family protein [Streptomyces sp. NPDC050504]|uniref:class I adenylate-forming enzyme family protein n=1 Tax=Streptomyces sp. NPDC050504 TaxID=3365618 RepID=UPI00378DEC49
MIKLDDIRRHAAGDPDRIALAAGGASLTWRALADVVEGAAAGLVPALPSDRPARAVLLTSESGWEAVVALAACATLGIPCAPLDPGLGEAELGRLLGRIEPCAVFVGGGAGRLLERCAWPGGDGVLRVFLDEESATDRKPAPSARQPVTFACLQAAEPVGQLPPPQPYESLSLAPCGETNRIAVRKTSTEGRQLIDLVDEFGFDADDVHLFAAPLWEPVALGLARAHLALGATVVLAPHDDPAGLARAIGDEQITTAVVAPDTLTALLAGPAGRPVAESARLRCVLTLGRHLGRWVVNTAWERLGPVLHLVHGTAETGLNTVLTPEESLVAPLRSGRPTLGNTFLVVGDDGEPLPEGQAGRIALAGYRLMDHYLDGDAELPRVEVGSAGSARGGGAGEREPFRLTGELGRIDERGRLVVTGRTAEVVALARDSDADTALFRLESDLLNLPCLRDTAVMRVDLPELGDALVVPFIAVAVGREVTGRAALTAACARRVPFLPAHVIPVDTIPYSPTGRIDTAELLESVLPIITLNLQLEKAVQQEVSA